MILVADNSPINSVAELKGRKVAFQKGSSSHNLLLRALQQAGLKFSDIQPVYLAPADARAAFQQGNVDAPGYLGSLLLCGAAARRGTGTERWERPEAKPVRSILPPVLMPKKNGAFIEGVLATFSRADAPDHQPSPAKYCPVGQKRWGYPKR